MNTITEMPKVKVKVQPKATVKVVTDKMLQEIKTPAYQRPINPKRIPEIKTSVTEGAWIPPIVLVETGGETYIMDGQHRLEARRQMEFELLAVIVPMNQEDAIKNFLVTNTTARKVSMKHRLAVDPANTARKIRELALEFDATPHQVYAIISGMVSGTSAGASYQRIMSKASRIMPSMLIQTREFLNYWTKDTRWSGGAKTIYDKPLVLQMISALAYRGKNPMESVKKMRNSLDFSSQSTLSQKRAGHGHEEVRRGMRDFIMEQVFLKGI